LSKRSIVILIFVLVVGILAISPFILEKMGYGGKRGGIVGSKAPNFKLKSIDGETVELSKLNGSVVLLDFWTTWCKPCTMAVPFLSRLHAEYADQGLIILSVNIGEDPSIVSEFADKHKMQWTVLLDQDRSVAELYGVRAIPTFIVIDKNEIVRFRKAGYSESVEHDIVSIIEEALSG